MDHWLLTFLVIVTLFQRFVTNEFSSEHVPSTTKSEYFPSLVLNDNLFELKIIDLPPIPAFPATTDIEWRDFRFYGLRSATAYLLVYDVTSPASFRHIKQMRDQMVRCRDMTNVPVIVVGNKMDLSASQQVIYKI